MKKIIKKIFIFLMVILLMFVLVDIFITSPVKVIGHSMEPEYMDRKMFMVNKFTYKFSDLARGDVVNYETSENKFISRIVGLPGEEVVITKGSVFIDGTKINEPYANWDKYMTNGKKAFNLKNDEYLLLNDNRNSLINTIKKSSIIGKIY